MNTKVEKLEERVERICGVGNAWIPSWLRIVGSREEIAEWRAIRQARRGRDCHERMLEFIRGMRKKNPDMPLSFEEELEAKVKELHDNPALAKAEGIEWVLQRRLEEPSGRLTFQGVKIENASDVDEVVRLGGVEYAATHGTPENTRLPNAWFDKFRRERE